MEEQNRRSGRGRRVKLAAVYLLAALAAALGWLRAGQVDAVAGAILLGGGLALRLWNGRPSRQSRSRR